MFRKFILSQTRRFSTQQKSTHIDLNLIKIPDAYALELTHIGKAVEAVPSLSSTPINLWESCYSVFRQHGIKAQKFIEMIIDNPMFLSQSSHKLTRSFEVWRTCQFGEKNCLQLLIKYPQLLFVSDETELISQVTYLRKYVRTTKNVYQLIHNAPNVITDSRDSLDKKFVYLLDIMRFDIPEIVKCAAMSQSLINIEIRHKFLDRLGLFKVPSLKLDRNKPPNNPRLYEIIDTNDQMFAENICKVTLDEYEVFKEIYGAEIKQRDNNNVEDEI